MTRPRFDPFKVAPRPPGEQPAEAEPKNPLSVSQLAQRLDEAIRGAFPARVWVIGEVSNLHDRTHLYFDLKDEQAVVGCVMFASSRRRASEEPRQGRLVIASGRMEHYARGGRVSLIVDSVRPAGDGAIDGALNRLLDELRALGWLAQERKRPLPIFPRRIAVITSRAGAALQDVAVTAKRRCPGVKLCLIDTPVQGDGAAERLAAAVAWVDRNHEAHGIDAVLITRGGGSREDLWAFNDRELARAIVRCAVPVVAAIGHETDTTIAELVADERCATPTQAAMRLVPDAAALTREIVSLHARLARSASAAVVHGAGRLDELSGALSSRVLALAHRSATGLERLAGRLERGQPRAALARRLSGLEMLERRLVAAAKDLSSPDAIEHLATRLARALPARLERSSERLDAFERQLEAVGPLQVLRRGYSLTIDPSGRVVRSSEQVRRGQRVRTRLAEGEFSSIVEHVAGGEPAPAARLAPSSQQAPGPQMDLFDPRR